VYVYRQKTLPVALHYVKLRQMHDHARKLLSITINFAILLWYIGYLFIVQ